MHDMIEILGNPASPYSRKLIAALRYRRIPHIVHWGMGQPPDGYPSPKVPLMPVAYMADDSGQMQAVTDTTPILEHLETTVPSRRLIPDDPATAFLNALIEDYADEWLTKAMFHYRWSRDLDANAAGALLAYLKQPSAGDAEAEAFRVAFSARQIGRLTVVGATEITGPVIEAAFERFLGLLHSLIDGQGFVLGTRPSTADFAIYGQLTQLGLVDPTPAALLKSYPRLHAWMLILEDLSGLEPGAWAPPNHHNRLHPLLQEIARTYGRVMAANGAALADGKPEFSCQVQGVHWQQATFPYQGKCLTALQRRFANLDSSSQSYLADMLSDAGGREFAAMFA